MSNTSNLELSLMLLIISIGASLSSYSLVAYAGGPRLDYDEAYTDEPGAP